jgi:hypothetical protein
LKTNPRADGVSTLDLVLASGRLRIHHIEKLKEQEEYLDQHVCGRFTPILFRPPDRVSGEVFPTMWYASPIALTGMQHMMIAKMILVGESPFLS